MQPVLVCGEGHAGRRVGERDSAARKLALSNLKISVDRGHISNGLNGHRAE